LKPGDTVLDIGCGNGRHVLELASLGFESTGVDYLPHLIHSAQEQARSKKIDPVHFIVADCRYLRVPRLFDAVICLYDVIGSYADDSDNRLIVEAIARHLKPGALALLSVMNFELTNSRAKHFFSLAEEPNRLLELKPSQTMEQTGDVFNPDFYMIDRETRVVYRKEQFAEGTELPVQLVVRDRRYTTKEIEDMCKAAGLEVVWSRCVRSGYWHEALNPGDKHAKEILVLCRRPPNG